MPQNNPIILLTNTLQLGNSKDVIVNKFYIAYPADLFL